MEYFGFYKNPKRRITCPYCLKVIESRHHIENCSQCNQEIPPSYISNSAEAPPFFAQMIGWSQAGKTVYLSALTLMLRRMARLWRDQYTLMAVTEHTQEYLKGVDSFIHTGILPPPTALGLQDAYAMVILNMKRWGGRAFVIRDCAGENFESFKFPEDELPYLPYTPATMFFLNLSELFEQRRSPDILMTSYLNTLLRSGINLRQEKRTIIIVISKADMISNLPENLRYYLNHDPIEERVTSRSTPAPFDAKAMAQYIETMARVSDEIRDWLESTGHEANLSNMFNMAQANHIDVRFAIVSSTGGGATTSNGQLAEHLRPRRVLDPFFWALEVQSFGGV